MHPRTVPSVACCLALSAFAACSEADEVGECLAPQPALARTYEVDLSGFPEADGSLFEDPEGLRYTGTCELTAIDFVDGTLTMSLDCEHPAPSSPDGAQVAISTAAAGVPAGVGVGDELSFSATGYFSLGGDQSGPQRLLSGTNVESYALHDEQGLIFAANPKEPNGDFGDVVVEDEPNCPGWQGCGGDRPPISGYVVARSGGSSIDVQVGEIGQLVGDSSSWDVSLFASRYDPDDCHFGISGDVSVVRRPG